MATPVTASVRTSVFPPHVDKRAEAKATANAGVQGVWENGIFRFASPQAVEAWRRKAYAQGVNENTWHLGDEVDDKTRDLAMAGIGGPMPPLYQGPDGKYRFGNAKTVEDPTARDHRLAYLKGKTIDQIAAKIPGEDEWVEKGKVLQAAANDNVQPLPSGQNPRVTISKGAPVAVTGSIAKTKKAPRQQVGGRGPLPGSFNRADYQNVRDLERIGANAIFGNYGDEGRAALAAIGELWDGRTFKEAYDSRLVQEKTETAAAQERQGLKGTGVEVLTSFIPVIGDVSGAAADFKDWKEHGDDWGWSDYGLVALGIVPGMPNRRVAKGTLKIGEELIDAAGSVGDEIADLGKKSSKADSIAKRAFFDRQAALEEAKKKVFSPKEARRLDTENRGLIYVQGNLQGPERARAHQSGGEGAFSDIESGKFADPALRFDNANPRGLNYIRFDSAFVADDGSYTMLVDSKTKLAIWSKKTQRKTIGTLERAKQAIQQNPNHKLMYEFDTEEAAEEARIFIRDNKYSAYVQVGVRKK